jgi:hypothetical protein
MKKSKLEIGRIIFFTFLFTFCIVLPHLNAQDKDEYIGQVKATEYDEDGNVINAVIVIEYEEEDDEGNINTYEQKYNIEVDTTGKKLLELDGATIRFIGTFIENDDGSISVKVESFNIISSVEDYEEDEEN